MDVSELLEPRPEEGPSGENLEYDPAFVDLELTAQHGEERQEGDKILEAEEPDWSDVLPKALAILERSHDIRAAVYYAEAVLHTEGLTGFAKATAYVRGCLEQHWETCHPQLDEDDDNDPTMRINAVKGLSGAETVIRALRRTALTESRMFGRLSLRMIEIAEGTVAVPEGMTEIPDTSAVAAAFKDTEEEQLSALLAAAISARADIKAIDEVFVSQTPGQGPDLEAVTKCLDRIVRRLSEVVGGEAGAETAEGADAPAAAEPGAPAGGAGAAPAPPGAINSPTDVANTLDRIIAYYHRAEPSSPLPLLLERAKRLVGADFMAIMRDMAPQGVDNVNLIGGLDDDE